MQQAATQLKLVCRHCHAEASLPFIDLGTSPPSNAYLRAEDLTQPEKYYPLRVYVCTNCWLVQTEDYAHHAELFSPTYAYFSSISATWLEHAEHYVLEMAERFSLSAASHVIEVASNDGYLLQYVQASGIPCLGIEPTSSTAQAARQKGIEVIEAFFGVQLAKELKTQGITSDLAVANNVLAHVPDINDFVGGFAQILKPQGVATFEFPHLLNLLKFCEFDTVYHEHFSYLSLAAVKRIFEANGLTIFDVEKIETHGGSLRVFAQRSDTGARTAGANVGRILQEETAAGVATAACYQEFQLRAEEIKNSVLEFLLKCKRDSKIVIGYGAAAKGNTLLNFAGVRRDLLPVVVDLSPAKVGTWLPGSRIPVAQESRIREMRPDFVIILPWNIKTEVMAQLAYIREWGGKFACFIPEQCIA
jgi:2-polyprenyl-3-methyl-5-hydroxy-6-metoxy-1,4-benzoquinol methylase